MNLLNGLFTQVLFSYVCFYRRLTIEIVVITQGLFAKYLDKAQSKLKFSYNAMYMYYSRFNGS